MQEWIDKYVSAIKWQRCLMTLRQKRSRKKHDLRKVELPIDVYLTVKNLAENMNCAMWEAINNVAEQALKKIYYSHQVTINYIISFLFNIRSYFAAYSLATSLSGD